MNFSEMVSRNENMSFKDVLSVLLPIYMDAHNWNVDDSVNAVYEKKQKYILNSILEANVNNNKIIGKAVYDYEYDSNGDPVINSYDGPEQVLIHVESYVNMKSLVKYVIVDLGDASCIPSELLKVAGIEPKKITPGVTQNKPDPAIATELGTLRNEKIKWDASIKAATEIGLLFYDGELTKPTTKDAFVEEFNSRVGGLPDTTIEMIYKALPSDYRNKGGKPKKASTVASGVGAEDMDIAIETAVLAGTLYESPDTKDTDRFSKFLKDNDFKIPSVEVLKKIIKVVGGF